MGGYIMDTKIKNEILLPSERPREELEQALADYERENPNKFTFGFDTNDHVRIERCCINSSENWQEFVIPDFVWGFKVDFDRVRTKRGLHPSINLFQDPSRGFPEKYQKVKISGGEGLRSVDEMVYRICNNVTHLDISQLEVRNVTSGKFMLFMCWDLLEVIGLEQWNVSNFRNFSGMFLCCCNLITISDLSNWNMQSATNLMGMFAHCVRLEKISGIDQWSVHKIKSLEAMFYNCKKLSDIGDLGKWSLSNCRQLNYMFYHCESLTTIGEIDTWNAKKFRHPSACLGAFQPTSIMGLFEGSSINFKDPKHIIDTWCEKNPLLYLEIEENFFPMIYPNTEVSKTIDIEKFMPDLRLHHELFTWTTSNNKRK